VFFAEVGNSLCFWSQRRISCVFTHRGKSPVFLFAAGGLPVFFTEVATSPCFEGIQSTFSKNPHSTTCATVQEEAVHTTVHFYHHHFSNIPYRNQSQCLKSRISRKKKEGGMHTDEKANSPPFTQSSPKKIKTRESFLSPDLPKKSVKRCEEHHKNTQQFFTTPFA